MIASWGAGGELRYHPSLEDALASGRPLILSLQPGVFPYEGLLERFLDAAVRDGVSLVYSSYDTDDGTMGAVDFNRDITERFPFGPVRGWHRERLLGLGVEKFLFAWEYAARLRWEEEGLLPHPIREPLYFYAPDLRPRPDLREYLDGREKEENRLYSDSFAYLRYPPGAEREFRAVFVDFLRRQGAFLEDFKPQRSFPPGKGDHEVMASVVIPVRNREGFIGQAIESALGQDHDDYEIVVVDNASEDRTRQVVKGFSDPRVRLVENPPGSIAFALNTGVARARGKYIIQLDSDDALAPGAVRAMVEFMETHPFCGLAISYYQLVDEGMKPLPEGVVKHEEYDRNNILRCEGAGAVRCWRKAVLEEIGGFDEEFGNYGEDYDAVLKVSERYEVGRVHEVLYFYRRHPGSQDTVQSLPERLSAKTRIRHRALERRKELVKKRAPRGHSPRP